MAEAERADPRERARTRGITARPPACRVQRLAGRMGAGAQAAYRKTDTWHSGKLRAYTTWDHNNHDHNR